MHGLTIGECRGARFCIYSTIHSWWLFLESHNSLVHRRRWGWEPWTRWNDWLAVSKVGWRFLCHFRSKQVGGRRLKVQQCHGWFWPILKRQLQGRQSFVHIKDDENRLLQSIHDQPSHCTVNAHGWNNSQKKNFKYPRIEHVLLLNEAGQQLGYDGATCGQLDLRDDHWHLQKALDWPWESRSTRDGQMAGWSDVRDWYHALSSSRWWHRVQHLQSLRHGHNEDEPDALQDGGR